MLAPVKLRTNSIYSKMSDISVQVAEDLIQNEVELDWSFFVDKFVAHLNGLQDIGYLRRRLAMGAVDSLESAANHTYDSSLRMEVLITEEEPSPSSEQGADSDPSFGSHSSSESEDGVPIKRRKADSSDFAQTHRNFVRYMETHLKKYIGDARHDEIPIRPVVPRDPPYITTPIKKLNMRHILTQSGVTVLTYKDWIRLPPDAAQ